MFRRALHHSHQGEDPNTHRGLLPLPYTKHTSVTTNMRISIVEVSMAWVYGSFSLDASRDPSSSEAPAALCFIVHRLHAVSRKLRSRTTPPLF